jgi:DNA-binding PadR family transcriptional regulator
MTVQTQAVLRALLDSEAELYGLEIVNLSGLAAGTIYPILQRLSVAGWVRARWEHDDEAHAEGRPARRYYALSPEGRTRAVHVLGGSSARRGSLARLLANPVAPRPLEGR